MIVTNFIKLGSSMMKEENIFCDIDNKANGLLTNLTYVVLFLNDQAYNYAMRLLDDIKKQSTTVKAQK